MATFDEFCASELPVHEWLLPRSSRFYTCINPLCPICQFERDLVPAGNRILVTQLQAVFFINWNTEGVESPEVDIWSFMWAGRRRQCGQSMVQSLPIDAVVLRLTERRSANWERNLVTHNLSHHNSLGVGHEEYKETDTWIVF